MTPESAAGQVRGFSQLKEYHCGEKRDVCYAPFDGGDSLRLPVLPLVPITSMGSLTELFMMIFLSVCAF